MSQDFSPNELYTQEVHVRFEYPVVFTRDVFAEANQDLLWAISRNEPQRRHPVLFAVDSGVHDAWPELDRDVQRYVARNPARLELRGQPLIVAGGEAGKNDPGCVESLLDAFAAARLDRQATVVAIGGGAALDVIGYAAAIVHRGVRIVRLPTTVLSQNDAGVGVKNGVNAFGAKNFLGTFAPPFAVVNDSHWLSTLPERDVRAGLAEAVKVGLIRDAAFFEWLEANAEALGRASNEAGPNPALEHAIRRCAELHLQHIRTSGDPFEMGSARPLDYGHWAAHRLEIITDHELRHGEAVAIGMLLDARYANSKGLLAKEQLERLSSLLRRLGLPRFHPALQRRSDGRLEVLLGLDQFREHLGGTLCVTLLSGVGESAEVNEMDETTIAEAIEWLAREHSH